MTGGLEDEDEDEDKDGFDEESNLNDNGMLLKQWF